MKTFFLTAAIATCALLVGCSSSEKAEKNEVELSDKIENCSNSDSMKIYVDQARVYMQRLVADGKLSEAKDYLAKIQPIVKDKAPSLVSRLDTISRVITNYGSSDAVEEVGDSLKSKVQDAKEAAGDAVDKIKDAAGDAADKAKDAVGNTVDKAKDTAADAARKGSDKVKEILSK